jgi:hypothetical protein
MEVAMPALDDCKLYKVYVDGVLIGRFYLSPAEVVAWTYDGYTLVKVYEKEA